MKSRNYRIVDDPKLADSIYTFPPALEAEKEYLFEKSAKGKNSLEFKLKKLIDRYPKCIELREYLVTWYSVNNRTKESYTINDEILKLDPKNINSFAHKIVCLLDEGDVASAENLIGDKYNIDEHFPERKAIDITEYRAFVSAIIRYLAQTQRLAEAREQIKKYKEVDTEPIMHRMMEETINGYKHYAAAGTELNDYKDEIVYANPQTSYTLPQKETALIPFDAQFAFLYQDNWEVNEAELTDLLKNNQPQFIAELQHIITSAIEGYEYNKKSDIWNHAVLHALFLLPYIDDESTFAQVIELYRQPHELVEYWIIDWGEDLVNRYYKHFSEAKLELIYKLMTDAPGSTWHKILFISLLPKFTVHQPEVRNELVAFIKKIIDFFIENRYNQNIFDINILTFIVDAAVDLKAIELLDTILMLFDKDWVGSFVCGSYEEVNEKIQSNTVTINGEFYDDILPRLHYFLERWNYTIDEDDTILNETTEEETKKEETKQKIETK